MTRHMPVSPFVLLRTDESAAVFLMKTVQLLDSLREKEWKTAMTLEKEILYNVFTDM